MKLLKQLYIQVLIGLAAAGFTFSVFYGSLIPALVGITVAVIGPSSIRPSFYVMPSRFLTGAAAAVGIAFIHGFGNLGGMVGPVMVGWLKDVTGSYKAGMLGMAGTLVIPVRLTISLKFIVKEE
jgi:nitrate/nitrite transporter NarK